MQAKKTCSNPIRAPDPLICSQRIVCDLPCVSGGQGRWTRSVTHLTRYMSLWQFWLKWEMGRLRTFKRPGAGVAIRAPATQTLPPVAEEGRLRRLVNDQCGSEAKTLAEVMVQEGVTTCQAAACHADSGAASRACGDLQTWSSTHTSQRVPAWKE